MTIIGLIGLKRSGKDTFADYIVEKYGYEKYSFAGPLKDACKIMFCLNDEQIDGNLKEVIDPRFGISPRHMFQFMGTEVMRELFPKISEKYTVKESFWIHRFKIWYNDNKDKNIIVSDIRFQDEANAIKNLGGTLIKINNPRIQNIDNHKSEKDVDNLQYDYIINNDETIENYYNNIEKLMTSIVK